MSAHIRRESFVSPPVMSWTSPRFLLTFCIHSKGRAMSDGFLGYKASLMLDVVVCALLVVVPTLLFSLCAVKVRRNYRLHKTLQIALGVVLLTAVGLFEIDMRMHGGITGILAKRTRPLTPAERSSFDQLLVVHLFFAISTVILWATTLT